jgi:hypothetical protein
MNSVCSSIANESSIVARLGPVERYTEALLSFVVLGCALTTLTDRQTYEDGLSCEVWFEFFWRSAW